MKTSCKPTHNTMKLVLNLGARKSIETNQLKTQKMLLILWDDRFQEEMFFMMKMKLIEKEKKLQCL